MQRITRELPDGTKQEVLSVPAVVKTLDLSKEKELTLNNDKKTPYFLGTAQVEYPDGSTDDVLTRFYSASIEAHKDVFKVGGKINIEAQIDGDYAGRAVAKLAGNLLNIKRMLGTSVVKQKASDVEEEVDTVI